MCSHIIKGTMYTLLSEFLITPPFYLISQAVVIIIFGSGSTLRLFISFSFYLIYFLFAKKIYFFLLSFSLCAGWLSNPFCLVYNMGR